MRNKHISRPRPRPHFGQRIVNDVRPSENSRFQLSLSEVDEMAILKVDEWVKVPDEKKDEPPKVETVSGDAELVAKLLNKAEPIEAKDDDEKEFFKREQSLKPPIPGEIVNLPFPGKPEERAELKFDPKDLNLEEVAKNVNVTRFFPEGHVSYPVSRLKIAFDQPMVSVGTVDDVADEFAKTGIKIQPEAKGDWRWSGTKLCQFMAEHRFRYSSEYKVTVPKGLKSALGGSLENDASFSFSTPLVQISSFSAFPRLCLDPVVCVSFNQDVKKDVIYRQMSLSGGKVKMEVIDPSDEKALSDHKGISEQQKKHIKSFWQLQGEVGQARAICLRFTSELKKGSTYTWSIPSNTVMGEGPLPTRSALSSSFRTYSELKITNHYPSPSHRYTSNYPGTEWTVSFSTKLDRRSIRREHFEISPKVTGVKLSVQGSYVRISHDPAEVGKCYKLKASREIADKWGQNLTGNDTVVFKTVEKMPPPRKWATLSATGRGGKMTLDPFTDNPELLISVTNYAQLKVTAYHCDPKQLTNREIFGDRRRKGWEELLKKKVREDIVDVKITQKEENAGLAQPFRIPLSDYYQNQKDNLGQIFVTVEPTKEEFNKYYESRRGTISKILSGSDADYRDYRPIHFGWLERTRLALSVFSHGHISSKTATAWVTDFRSGAPVPNVEVLVDGKVMGKTDSRGLVSDVPVPNNKNVVWSARKDGDVACLAHNAWFENTDSAVWYSFTDRGMYKPNEEVSIKGYVRYLKTQGEAKIPTYVSEGKLDVKVHGPRSNLLWKGSVALSKFGSFKVSFKLPDNVNLGSARATFKGTGVLAERNHTCNFQVQEFRTPEFRVSASHRPTTHHFMNALKDDWDSLNAQDKKKANQDIKNVIEGLDLCREANKQSEEDEREREAADDNKMDVEKDEKTKAAEAREIAEEENAVKARLAAESLEFKAGPDPCVIASVQADYFAGGGLSDAKVKWEVKAKTAAYTPPHNPGYSFGKSTGWWWMRSRDNNLDREVSRALFEGKTDAKGHAEVALSWSGLRDDACSPLNIQATASVMDLNNQAREASTSFILHPCRHYVGFKLHKAHGEAGKPLSLSVVVVDVDGKLAAGKPVQLALRGTRHIRLRDAQGLSTDKSIHTVVTKKVVSGSEAVDVAFVPEMGGNFEVSLRVCDDFGGWHRSSSSSIYVSDPKNPEDLKGVVSYDQLSMWRVPVDSLTLIPDKQTYDQGDIASIVVRAPFTPASGTLTIDCEGLKGSVMPFDIKPQQDSVEIKIKVKKEWIPGFRLSARVHGNKTREASARPVSDAKNLLRPARAEKSVEVSVSRGSYAMEVDVTPSAPSDHVAPGKLISSSVTVKDFAGNPVSGAEVCLVMVDEAILSLSGHSLSNPLSVMYPKRWGMMAQQHTHNSLYLLPVPEEKEVEAPPEPDPEEVDDECDGMMPMAMASRGFGGGAPRMMKKSKGMVRSRGAAPRGMRMMMQAAPMAMAGAAPAMNEMKSLARAESMDEGALGLDDDGPIGVRKNFNPLAAFAPSGVTDAKGEAKFTVELPDNLTSYRVWAMAVTDTLYGLGESTLSVSLPLMVRPSPPRFLNFGDKAQVSVVLQNQTPKDLVALIAARATNATVDPNKAAAKVTLKALQRGVVTFGVDAAKAGKARLQFVSSTRGASDAAEVEIPVFTPATSEGFATYGSVDVDGQDSDMQKDKSGEEVELTKEEEEEEEGEGENKRTQLVVQPIKAPRDVWPQFGGLEVSTSTTQLHHLTDAVISLYEYEYECSEQLASRILGMLSVRPVLEAFSSNKLPTPEKLKDSVHKWLKILYSRQYRNGGFWMWGPPSLFNILSLPSPYTSIHVSCCLALCEENKFEVKPRAKSASLTYLRNIEERLRAFPLSRFWAPRWHNGIVSFALYARTLWGENVAAEAAKFYKARKKDDFRPEAVARLLVALSKEPREHRKLIAELKVGVEKHMTEEADTAYFTGKYDEVGRHIMLGSNRVTDANMLEALIAVDGNKNTLSPKLCKGLLKHKLKSGGWGSTQENCWILFALLRYFQCYEKHVPSFVVSLWYGNLFGGKQEWKGRSVQTKQLLVNMRGIQALGDNNFILHKEGKGRLYYRMGMIYAPKSLKLSAANYGFLVERTYAAAGRDDPKNVRFDEKTGAWQAKLGERVKVTITMTSTSRRYHVALVDFLPAGLEPLNPALKGTPKGDEEDSAGSGATRRSGYYNPYTFRCYSKKFWPEHINLRDERAEAFRSLLWPGVYEFTYTARATTAGEFVVPPAKAEEMYSPENFGRSASEKFTVLTEMA